MIYIIKDAYYTLTIYQDHQKYAGWHGPRKLIKALKSPLFNFRLEGETKVSYWDDCINMSHSIAYAGTILWQLRKCFKALDLKYIQNLNQFSYPPKEQSF